MTCRENEAEFLTLLPAAGVLYEFLRSSVSGKTCSQSSGWLMRLPLGSYCLIYRLYSPVPGGPEHEFELFSTGNIEADPEKFIVSLERYAVRRKFMIILETIRFVILNQNKSNKKGVGIISQWFVD